MRRAPVMTSHPGHGRRDAPDRHADGPPSKSGIAIADIFTGLYAANAVQAALLRRNETGEGAYIDCALLDTMAGVLGYQALNYFVGGLAPKRMGNGHPNIVPYDVFPVADGDIISPPAMMDSIASCAT